MFCHAGDDPDPQVTADCLAKCDAQFPYCWYSHVDDVGVDDVGEMVMDVINVLGISLDVLSFDQSICDHDKAWVLDWLENFLGDLNIAPMEPTVGAWRALIRFGRKKWNIDFNMLAEHVPGMPGLILDAVMDHGGLDRFPILKKVVQTGLGLTRVDDLLMELSRFLDNIPDDDKEEILVMIDMMITVYLSGIPQELNDKLPSKYLSDKLSMYKKVQVGKVDPRVRAFLTFVKATLYFARHKWDAALFTIVSAGFGAMVTPLGTQTLQPFKNYVAANPALAKLFGL
jgi:hypothetical protein